MTIADIKRAYKLDQRKWFSQEEVGLLLAEIDLHLCQIGEKTSAIAKKNILIDRCMKWATGLSLSHRRLVPYDIIPKQDPVHINQGEQT